MTVVLTIIMMIVIGAIIGGLTNSLAIKMLFRPYEPKYIGEWKIPLTPGLIPKRRDELAKQLGKMVVEHLLTAEGIREKLNQTDFQQQLITWSQTEFNRLLTQKISLRQMLAAVGIYVKEADLRNKIANWTENRYELFMQQRRNLKIRELMDEAWMEKADGGIDQLTTYIQDQLSAFIASETAKQKIGDLIESYLGGKGFFGNMISSFLGNGGLADKVQPVLVEYSQSNEAKQWIKKIVTNEWNNLLDQPVRKVEDKIGKDPIKSTISKGISTNIPLEAWLDKSVAAWMVPFKSRLLNHVVPMIMEKVLHTLADRIDIMMEKLGLEEIVEKEVGAFPIKRVEQLVLNISKREFKLITYLGALLGGLIGLVQGIIVVLVG